MAQDRRTSKPRVTFCVPVSAGADGLQDALDAIAAQDFDGIAVALSLDGPDEVAEAACKAAAEAEAITWSLREEPMGRAANLNHLLFHVATEYAFVLRPGVLPEPGCVSGLVAALDGVPGAVCACADARARGRGSKMRRLLPAAEGGGPVQRLLALLSGADADAAVCGLIRTSALARAGRLVETPPGDALADVTFTAQLAREGALIHVPQILFRDGNPAAAKGTQSEAEDPEAAWTQHCADMVQAALATPSTVQEARLLWLAGVTRLVSPAHAAPFLQRDTLTTGQQETLVAGLLARMEAPGGIDLPWLLDEEWERIRRWTRGFVWSPRDKSAITDFGPQPVNAGQGFNPQPGGASTLWVTTEGRLPPGTKVRLGGRTLDTETDMNTATAIVPPEVTSGAGELPLMLVNADGSVRSNKVTFWVLRATRLGRSVVRMLRRLRGQPDPAARVALPAPKKKGS